MIRTEPTITYNDEHERNEFARAALTGILANQAEFIRDKEAVEWAFEIADRMMKASKAKPQLPN